MPDNFSPMPSIPGQSASPEGLMGIQQPSSPQGPGQMIDQQAGLFSQLESLHESIVSGKQVLMAIAQQFPVTAEPVRNLLAGIDAVSQGMPTLVTAMTSQVQEPASPSPMVLG